MGEIKNYGLRDSFFGLNLPFGGQSREWGVSEAIGGALGLSRNNDGGSELRQDGQTSSTSITRDTNTGGAVDVKTPTVKTNSNPSYQIGGWYNGKQWDGSRFGNPGEVIVGGDSPTNTNNQSSGVSNEEIDALFNPIFAALNNQRNTYKGLYESDLNRLATDKQTALDRNAQNKAETQTTLDSQKVDLSQQLDSALNQAIRAYNALSQRANVFYGGSTGTGQAMNELAAKEYYRSTGGTQQAYAKQFGSLQDSVRKAELFYSNAEQDIDSEYQSNAQQLFKNYVGALQQIDAEAAYTESQKRARKFEIKDRANQLEQQLAYQYQQSKLALSEWKQKMDYQMQQEMYAVNQSMYTTPQNTFDAFASDLNFGTSGDTQQTAYNYNYKAKDDEWAGIFA